MLATAIGDPRLQELFGTADADDRSVRPVVCLPRKAARPALLVAVAAVASLALFSLLNERRTNQAEPSVGATTNDGPQNYWAAPPPLRIPAAEADVAEPSGEETDAVPLPLPLPAPVTSEARAPGQSRSVAPSGPPPGREYVPPTIPRLVAAPARPGGGAALLVDGVQGARPPFLPGASSQLAGDGRVRASAIAKPSLTVPQGTLLPAVLETGFDSTKPGFARAIISRDVRSFDGENILIPRGSRLIGESSSSTSGAQDAASITWTRLILPSGGTIDLDSPATDPEGRAGVPAKVNTHVLTRVGDAISRALGGLGEILAARASPFIVLPGNPSSAASRFTAHPKRAPTLRAAPGTSIGVFVAHDLEFSIQAEQQ